MSQLRVDEITNETGDGPPSIFGLSFDKVVTSNWEIEQEGNDIVFKFDGVTKLKLTSDGAIVAADDITAFGSP